MIPRPNLKKQKPSSWNYRPIPLCPACYFVLYFRFGLRDGSAGKGIGKLSSVFQILKVDRVDSYKVYYDLCPTHTLNVVPQLSPPPI